MSDNNSGGTALQSVIAAGNFEAANWLLEKGVKPDIPSHFFGITPLVEAADQAGPEALALMQKLLETGADPNRRRVGLPLNYDQRESRNSLLGIVTLTDSPQFEKLKFLLKHGADPKLDYMLLSNLLKWRDSASALIATFNR